IAYVAAIVYALGYAYFWPVLVGAVAQRVPLSSALGMSVIGAVGMFSSGIFQPFIGNWIDNSTIENTAKGLSGSALELATGQDTLQKMLVFPIILIVLFTILYFWQKGKKPALSSAH